MIVWSTGEAVKYLTKWRPTDDHRFAEVGENSWGPRNPQTQIDLCASLGIWTEAADQVPMNPASNYREFGHSLNTWSECLQRTFHRYKYVFLSSIIMTKCLSSERFISLSRCKRKHNTQWPDHYRFTLFTVIHCMFYTRIIVKYNSMQVTVVPITMVFIKIITCFKGDRSKSKYFTCSFKSTNHKTPTQCFV